MTELQMGLIGLGTIAVVGVVAYNKWQELRQRKQAEQALKANHPDVLLDEPSDSDAAALETEHVDMHESIEATEERLLPSEIGSDHDMPLVRNPVSPGERIEPVLALEPVLEESPTEPSKKMTADLEEVIAMPAEAVISPDREPAPGRTADPAPQASATHGPSAQELKIIEDQHLLSPLIDYIACIDAVEPAPAPRIIEAQREVLARVRKPVRFVGYNEEAGEWESILGQESAEYRHIRVGLQLVNRQGPANENDLAIFSVAMQDLADQLMGLVELPHRQPALDAAAKLDEFCASVDIQIGINLVSQGQVFTGTKLRALAEAAGMTIDAGKRFVRHDDEGNVLYLLLNQEATGFSSDMMKTMSTHGVTFLLDVPCVAHGERVFNQMVDLARRFAEVLHGTLVDDNRRPLSENALEPIRKQVGQYQALMAEHHLAAGSPLTKRLFS